MELGLAEWLGGLASAGLALAALLVERELAERFDGLAAALLEGGRVPLGALARRGRLELELARVRAPLRLVLLLRWTFEILGPAIRSTSLCLLDLPQCSDAG
ncbi:MAG: hypothetical protein HY319_24895 [Armatimonadetes bacterium]|nr:hypothetical protein [Armatimonadota bacterium]